MHWEHLERSLIFWLRGFKNIYSLYDIQLERNQSIMSCTFKTDMTMSRKVIKEINERVKKGLDANQRNKNAEQKGRVTGMRREWWEEGQKNQRKNSMIKVSQTPLSSWLKQAINHSKYRPCPHTHTQRCCSVSSSTVTQIEMLYQLKYVMDKKNRGAAAHVSMCMSAYACIWAQSAFV